MDKNLNIIKHFFLKDYYFHYFIVNTKRHTLKRSRLVFVRAFQIHFMLSFMLARGYYLLIKK